jgi:hypothetical protein
MVAALAGGDDWHPTGRASGIDVLDIDVKPDEGIDGRPASPHWTKLSPVIAATPSGGAHLYFRAEGKARCSTDLIAPGVDTRSWWLCDCAAV